MIETAPQCEARCPLCGGPNRCMMAQTGSIAGGCWCREVVFSQDLLSQIPEPLRGRACVCRTCAEGATLPPANLEDEIDASHSTLPLGGDL